MFKRTLASVFVLALGLGAAEAQVSFEGQVVTKVIPTPRAETNDPPIDIDINGDNRADVRIQVFSTLILNANDVEVDLEAPTVSAEGPKPGMVSPAPVPPLEVFGEWATIQTHTHAVEKGESPDDFFAGSQASIVTNDIFLSEAPLARLFGEGDECGFDERLSFFESAFLYLPQRDIVFRGDLLDFGVTEVGFEEDVVEVSDLPSLNEPGDRAFVIVGLSSFDSKVSNFGFLEIERGSITVTTVGFNPNVGGSIQTTSVATTAVPLPPALALFGAGLLALFGARRWA